MAKRKVREPLARPAGLLPSALHQSVDPHLLPFETTESLDVLEGVIEQERAMEALEMGLSIRKRNFNIFVAGASGTGKSSILRGLLKRVAEKDPVPPDWCMVNNFKRVDQPIVFSLPAGRGIELRQAIDQVIADLKVDLPKALHGKEHQQKVQRIYNEQCELENRSFLDLSKKALDIGFAVKSTKDGLSTIPIVEGKPVSNKEYSDLDENQRTAIESNRQKLEPVVSQFLEVQRDIELGLHNKLVEAQRDFGKDALGRHLKAVRKRFKDQPDVMRFIDSVETHILENLDRFLPNDSDIQKAERQLRRIGNEYRVNVLVDNSETKGAPVLFENTPTYHNLVGKIEKRVENGIYSTDFMMVKAGAMVRANGGYLVLHAKEVLDYPFAWESLKRLLKYGKVQIEEMGEDFQFLPTSGIRPDPIPVQCKVILIGSNYLYEVLSHYDEDFSKTFQVKAEFDSEVKQNPETLMDYSRFVATTCKRDQLLPVDRDGVAAVIECGARIAGSSDRMTLRFNEICGLLIEADVLARAEGAAMLTRPHIVRANAQRLRRVSLIADKSLEDVLEGTMVLDTSGSQVGVINGLAVYQFADFSFGRPLRLTAKTFQGKGGVVNIEREARLSGNTHSKGVLITSGFLGDRFARKRPLSLTVTLTIEQSYARIDGDSASLAGLCAILSSLAEIPIRQDLAVTGSISQRGEVQAIGGVNEKIEGFFQVCQARGLTGTQGVLIPATNVRHLMLNPDVVDAARQGLFHIYPVSTVEEAVALLMEMPAGEPDDKGEYPKDTVFALAAATLTRYAGKKKKDD